MTLKAKQTRFPFIVLAIISTVGVFCNAWIFFRSENFSTHSFVQQFGSMLILFVFSYLLAINFRKMQSVELSDDGVWFLVWVSPKLRIWPRFEKKLLKWGDIQRWVMRANLIYLYGPEYKVVINVLLFEDANAIIKLINSSTGATAKS